MKKTILFWVFLFSCCSYSQNKSNWNNTFIYPVQLADGLDNYAGIYLNIKYKKAPLVSKTKRIGGKSTKIQSEFIYLNSNSSQIGTVKLPFSVASKTYYWLLDGDMIIEMALYPERFKIDVTTANPQAAVKYKLPETFDLISENALNIAYLQSFSPSNRNKLLEEKTWKLVVEKKEIVTPKTNTPSRPIEKDTLLVFSVRQGIPKGIRKAIPDLNEDSYIKSMQEHTVKGLLYNNKLFLKIPEKKDPKTIPDRCYGAYTTLQGIACATTGGMTGQGCGECGIKQNSKIKPIYYSVTIQIEP
jgi:hypothetical protein